MERISDEELKEIIESYGLDDLVFDTFKQVEPDKALYVFHGKEDTGMKYCLIVADYLDSNIELPCSFKFDYYPDSFVSFKANRIISYVDNAKKTTDEYIDDNHYLTMASTGDVCMFLGVDELKA